MQILLVSNDLTVVSRVQGSCAKIGATMRTAADGNDAVAALDSDDADIVILDLSTPQLDIDTLVSATKARTAGTTKVIAFGPHVHAEKLDAARRAGCDEVVSRGQFFAQFDALLQQWAGK